MNAMIANDIQFDIEFLDDTNNNLTQSDSNFVARMSSRFDNKTSNELLTRDYINEKRFSIYDNSKPLLNENELKQIIETCDEKLDLTNYTILGALDITKCEKNIVINCSNTKLSNIECSNPNIELKELKCLSNNLTDINNLKLNNLVRLFCGYNKIINLDELSQNTPNLKYLDCAGNPIISLDNLPEELIYLNCENCKICELNNLPTTLQTLICSNNSILTLDYLPESIIQLSCVECEITYLDNLPSSINELSCYSNKITQLFNLPKNLRLIKCDENIQLENYPNDLEIVYF